MASADDLRERFRMGCREALTRTGQRFVDEARDKVPVRTGALKASITDAELVDESEISFTVRIAAEADYAEYVEFPTMPHIIEAVNAPLLTFYWADGPRGPGVYRFKQVQHPGTTAQPFLIPSEDDFREALREELLQEPFFHLAA